MKDKRHYVWLQILLLIMILLVYSSACENTHNNEEHIVAESYSQNITDGYKRFINTEGIVKFTFEYPENYDDYRIIDDIEIPWISCSRWENNGWLDSSIDVIAWKKDNDKYETAETYRINDFNLLTQTSTDFRLLRESQADIDNITGTMFKVSYFLNLENIYESDLKESTVLITRRLFFNHGDFVWKIMMTSIEKVAAEDEVGWEHLIESFTFLD